MQKNKNMKKTLFFLFVQLAFLPLLKAGSPIKLKCIVDSVFTQEDQWAYWFCLCENEYSIADSCLLKKGQKSFHFEKTFEDSYFSSWITFSKCGPNQLELCVVPGEDVVVYIVPNSLRYPRTEGSIATQDKHEQYKKLKQIFRRINELKVCAMNTTDSTLIKAVLDSVSDYEYYRDIGNDIELLLKTKSAYTYVSTLSVLKDRGYFSDEQIDSLENELLVKFPNDAATKKYFNKRLAPPATAASRKALSRFDEIMATKWKTPIVVNRNYTKEFLTPKQSALYNIGSHVSDISLEDITGAQIKLSDIKKEYVLIDFWASWCGPCCRAYSDLLKAQKRYNKELCIYAISIDSNQDSWRSTVKRLDPEHTFTHVRVVPGSEKGKVLSKQYGVTRIPANFLLDVERKIIAMDLTGNDLQEKMSELIKDDL